MPLGIFYGRMNPFTKGHASALNAIRANGRTPIIIVSHTQKIPNNPLTANEKINLIREAVKGVEVFSTTKNKPTIFGVLNNLKKRNANIKVYLGSNRISTLGNSLVKAGYLVGQFGGKRNNSKGGLSGVSGTKARLAAVSGNTPGFLNMLSPTVSAATANRIAALIRNRTASATSPQTSKKRARSARK